MTLTFKSTEIVFTDGATDTTVTIRLDDEYTDMDEAIETALTIFKEAVSNASLQFVSLRNQHNTY